jgi:hypothetical protein
MRLRDMRAFVASDRRARDSATVCEMQKPGVERWLSSRVRAARAAVREASPTSRRNQFGTDHTETKANRPP